MRNQKGQVLLFVILTMTVAMAVGVGVSLRTISSISRTSRTDTAARVLAAAEGGAENYLVLPIRELETLGCPSCGGKKMVMFDPLPDDNISAIAEVTVDTYGDEMFYETEIQKDQVKEIYLRGYNDNEIQICWEALDGSGDPVDLYFIVYPNDGDLNDMVRVGVTQGGPGYPAGHETNMESASSGSCSDVGGYSNVYRLTGLPGNRTQVLRIRVLMNDARVAVNSLSGNPLPAQGYKITSVGKLKDASDEVTATKTVVVYKSRPYLPAIWDFGIYTEAGALD